MVARPAQARPPGIYLAQMDLDKQKEMTYFKTVISAILLLCCASLSYGQVQEGDTTEVVSLEGTVLTAEKKPVVYRLDRKRVSG